MAASRLFNEVSVADLVRLEGNENTDKNTEYIIIFESSRDTIVEPSSKDS